MRHPKLSELVAYTDPGMEDDARARVRAHLGFCDRCMDRLISLQTFGTAVRTKSESISKPFELTEECVPTELMGDFLGDRLPPVERDDYSAHVSDCDICFERAAYFTHSSAKMAEGVLHMEKTPQRYIKAVDKAFEETKPGPRKITTLGLLQSYLSRPVTAYALAASVLFFIAYTNVYKRAGIVSLDSNHVFTVYEAPRQSGPSFGFSDAGRKLGEIDAGLYVKQTGGGQVVFGWKHVKGAGEYRFSLVELRPTTPLEIHSVKTSYPGVTIGKSFLQVGKAYRWRVTGEKGPDKIFIATGQFVFIN